jgi:hypothetical protein
MLQGGKSRVRDPMRLMNFSFYLMLSTAPGLGVYSSSNRNEYQKQKIIFLPSRARPVHKVDNITAICEPTV